MAEQATQLDWQPIEALSDRLRVNCAALDARDPALAAALREYWPDQPCFIAAHGGRGF